MSRWALVSGTKGTGKSRAVNRAAEALAARGVAIAGFVQDAIEADGERVGYRLRRLGRPDTRVVARKNATPRGPEDEAFCSYVFELGAFDEARRWLVEDAPTARVLFLDEVSKLEVAGRGHHAAIRDALAGDAIVVLSVQAAQVFGVLERFELGAPVAALETAEGGDLGAFVDALADAAGEVLA